MVSDLAVPEDEKEMVESQTRSKESPPRLP